MVNAAKEEVLREESNSEGSKDGLQHQEAGDRREDTTDSDEVERLSISWCSLDVINTQVEHLKYLQDHELEENPHLEGLTESELFDYAAQDHDIFTWAWDDLTATLTEWLDEFEIYHAHVRGENMGWRSRDGYKVVNLNNARTTTGTKLLQEVLPNTENTFTITKYDDYLVISNAHHDVPMGGEMYFIYDNVECDHCREHFPKHETTNEEEGEGNLCDECYKNYRASIDDAGSCEDGYNSTGCIEP
jgi:hypothetical protein